MNAAMDAQPEERRRSIVTPEGVPLRVELADYGSRMIAALIDAAIMLGVTIAAAVLLNIVSFTAQSGELGQAYAGLFAFVWRVIYFPWFELHRSGQTPGKRAVGLRVIGRQGAPLEAEAVIARNLAREVEMWLPLTFFLTASGGGAADLAALAWVGCFCALPLFSKERMRGGDVIAGTWVILEPKADLQRDLLAAPADATAPEAAQSDAAEGAPAPEAPPPPQPSVQFPPAQLNLYGAKELNILAEVLRLQGLGAEERVAAVAGAIRAKIGADALPPDAPPQDRAFLEAYYAAARAKMETDAQWGRLRRDKADARGRR